MDSKMFGEFISNLRKEKGWTQVELANKLNVTDKAISRWERGLGFPDINTIEPLADAFGVSVLEIMHSERVDDEKISKDDANDAINSIIDVAQYMRKIEQRNIFIAFMIPTVVILLLFLLDNMPLIAFTFTCLPLIFLVVGIVSIIMAVCEKKQGKAYVFTLMFGVLMLVYPMILFLLLFFAFPLGALGMQ